MFIKCSKPRLSRNNSKRIVVDEKLKKKTNSCDAVNRAINKNINNRYLLVSLTMCSCVLQMSVAAALATMKERRKKRFRQNTIRAHVHSQFYVRVLHMFYHLRYVRYIRIIYTYTKMYACMTMYENCMVLFVYSIWSSVFTRHTACVCVYAIEVCVSVLCILPNGMRLYFGEPLADSDPCIRQATARIKNTRKIAQQMKILY